MERLSLYRPAGPAERLQTQRPLAETLEATLRLLHPFMPFITEEIWQRLPHKGESIMVAPYPKAGRKQHDPNAEREMSAVMDVVTAVRNIRGEMRIGPGTTLTVTLRPARGTEALFAATAPLIDTLARVRLRIDPRASRPRASALAVVAGSEVYVELARGRGFAAERARLPKESTPVTGSVEC